MVSHSLSDLIYEKVTDEYGWGKYGGIKVLIRYKDGYINLTKMCQESGTGKRFDHWLENAKAQKLVEAFKSVPRNSGTKPLEIRKGGSNQLLCGTYGHPDIVPHVASWASPAFALKVSTIINDHFVREHKLEIAKLNRELGIKQNTIDDLVMEVKDLHTKLDLANENIKEAVRGVNQANYNIVGVQNTLNDTSDRMVPSQHVYRKDSETYAIYYCHTHDGKHVYIQCRARPFHLRRRERKLRSQFSEFREVVCIPNVPNARTLASEFERRIKEKGAEFDLKFQSIKLNTNGTFTEEQLNEIAHEVYDERYEKAENAEELYSPVQISIDTTTDDNDDCKITYQDRFSSMLDKRLEELKEIARSFPRDPKYGGWSSKKNKTELINWILKRQGY